MATTPAFLSGVLEYSVDRGAWWAIARRVEKSQTQLSDQASAAAVPAVSRHSASRCI